MRAIVLSIAVISGLGSLGYAQNQPQMLKGVYGPPGSSALGASGKSSGLPESSNAPAGGAPRFTIPGGNPVQGQLLPNEVTAAPIADRPGYGVVVVNGRRAIVNLNTNRVFQVLN